MSYHYCELLLDRQEQSVIRLQVDKHWNRHDTIMHCIRRSYITTDEADKISVMKTRWSNSRLKGYIPLDKSPYIYKEFVDRYTMRGV